LSLVSSAMLAPFAVHLPSGSFPAGQIAKPKIGRQVSIYT